MTDFCLLGFLFPRLPKLDVVPSESFAVIWLSVPDCSESSFNHDYSLFMTHHDFHDWSRFSWLITIFMTDHRMYDHSRNNWSHQSERWISKSLWTQIWAGIKCGFVEFHKSTLDKTGKVRILKITSDWDFTKFQPFLTRQQNQRRRRVTQKPLKLFANFEEPNLKPKIKLNIDFRTLRYFLMLRDL